MKISEAIGQIRLQSDMGTMSLLGLASRCDSYLWPGCILPAVCGVGTGNNLCSGLSLRILQHSCNKVDPVTVRCVSTDFSFILCAQMATLQHRRSFGSSVLSWTQRLSTRPHPSSPTPTFLVGKPLRD